MEFDSLRELANPTILVAELAACAGVTHPINTVDALKAVALLRRLANHVNDITDNHRAIDWGTSYDGAFRGERCDRVVGSRVASGRRR